MAKAKQVWDKTNGGGGVYDGPPKAETVDGHTSAVERFTDDGPVRVEPWTAALALKVLGVSKATREEQIAVIMAGEKLISREAYAALKAGGYPVPAGVL